jgi:hypothetical protein
LGDTDGSYCWQVPFDVPISLHIYDWRGRKCWAVALLNFLLGHTLGVVSRAFSSWKRLILTEIYLCHACSYHEIEDENAWTGLVALRN